MRPTFVDLFAGAGGLSLGLQEAGWHPVLAVEHWPDAVETYRHNFRHHPVFDDDIAKLTAERLAELLPERPDWVVGGPPCQGFSTVGKRERSDPRNFLVREFVRVVAATKPVGVLVENVVGLRDLRFVEFFRDLLEGEGYTVTVLVLAAADFGVPQLRRRIFFVGHREGMHFIRPRRARDSTSYVTVWDAIGDLPPLQPGEASASYDREPFTEFQERCRRGSKHLQGHEASAHPPDLVELISHIPDGGNRRSIPAQLQPRSGFHNSYSRLHSGSPAVAVTQNMGKPSGTRCIHPFQHRGLTAREGARLQGFPDRFHFLGGVTSQRLQVANAVSPILACALGKALSSARQWTKDAGKAAVANADSLVFDGQLTLIEKAV